LFLPFFLSLTKFSVMFLSPWVWQKYSDTMILLKFHFLQNYSGSSWFYEYNNAMYTHLNRGVTIISKFLFLILRWLVVKCGNAVDEVNETGCILMILCNYGCRLRSI
jgi:ABC-type multidrug transport system permease subunit